MTLPFFTMPKLHWPGSTSSTRITLALKAVGIIAATTIIFHRQLTRVFSEAMQHGTTSYVLVVPFILVFLIYRKRKMLRAVMPVTEEEQSQNLRILLLFSGILLASIAILLYWYGTYTRAGLEYSMFALPLFAASLCLILFNSQTLRQLAFPIAFLVFLIPPPPAILSSLGSILQVTSAKASSAIVNAFNIPATLTYQNGDPLITLATPNGNDLFSVDLASSGIYSLILIGTLILLVACKELFSSKIFAGKSECPQCNSSRRSDEDYCRQCGRILRPASARLGRKDVAKLFSVFLVAGILLAFQSPFYVIAKGQSGVVIKTSTGEYSGQVFPNQSQYFFTFIYENQNYEALTKQDVSLNYLYSPINGSSEQILASLEIASAQSDLRNWETYVLSWPQSQGVSPRATQIEVQDVMLVSNPPTASRFFVFEYTDIDQIQAVLYWNETVNFMTNSTIEQKYVQICLIALPSSTYELPKVKNALIVLATAIADYWQPITTYSKATLVIIQNGPLLLAATSTGLAVTIIYYKAEDRRRKRSSQRAIEKLDKADGDVARAVRETKQPATIENIAQTLRESCPETITTEEVERRLEKLEKTKIIRTSTYGLDDEPLRIWKT